MLYIQSNNGYTVKYGSLNLGGAGSSDYKICERFGTIMGWGKHFEMGNEKWWDKGIATRQWHGLRFVME